MTDKAEFCPARVRLRVADQRHRWMPQPQVCMDGVTVFGCADCNAHQVVLSIGLPAFLTRLGLHMTADRFREDDPSERSLRVAYRALMASESTEGTNQEQCDLVPSPTGIGFGLVPRDPIFSARQAAFERENILRGARQTGVFEAIDIGAKCSNCGVFVAAYHAGDTHDCASPVPNFP